MNEFIDNYIKNIILRKESLYQYNQTKIETKPKLEGYSKNRIGIKEKIKEHKISEEKKIGLVLCPYEIVGRNQGGSIRTNNIIKELIKINTVISISFTWNESIKDYKITKISEKWLHIDLRHHGNILGYLNYEDFHFINWNSVELIQLARELSSLFEINYIWMEYSFMGIYKFLANEFNCKSILSLHNIEWKLAKEISNEKNVEYFEPIGGWAVAKVIEEEIIKNSEIILTTTENDKKYCNELKDTTKVLVAPNIISLSTVKNNNISVSDKIKLLFIGDFNYHPNISGLKWFLEMLKNQTDEIIKSLNFEIDVIGKGSNDIGNLNTYNGVIRAHGFVDDLSKYLEEASAVFIPLISGGGSRLKAYEAIENCKYIITTDKGIEGIDFSSLKNYIYLFANFSEFSDAIQSLRIKIKYDNYYKIKKDYDAWYQKEQELFINSIKQSINQL